MTTTDYLIAAALILLVVPQIRGTRLTLRNLVLPVVLVAAAAAYYLKSVPTQGHDTLLYVVCVGGGALLKSVPTQGHDTLLYVVCVGGGALLGAGCGLATRFVKDREGFVVAKAGLVAAVLWIVGMAARTGFEYSATHSGAQAIADFSRSNSITGADAWTAALLLMALAQVLVRLVTIRVRARALQSRAGELARA
jgi:hypothetical protein